MERFISALSLTLLLSGLAAVAQVAPSDNLMQPAVESSLLLSPGEQDGDEQEAILNRAELAQILVQSFHLDRRQPQDQSAVYLEDVPPSHWAYQDIQLVLQSGIMTGYREGRFFPEQRLTRVEAFSIFAQAHGIYQFSDQTVAGILAKYPDSAQIPSWARKPMATALQEGFINTRYDNQIDPLSPMTRADLAYALNQYQLRQTSRIRLPWRSQNSLSS